MTRRERLSLGLGLAVVVTAAAHLYLVEPMLTRRAETADLVSAREAALTRRRLLVASREHLEIQAAATAAKVEGVATRLLPGPTAAVAASELQREVKAMAAEANAEMRSERVLPAVEMGGLQEVGVELTVAGTLRETIGFLRRIERPMRLLVVKDVKIRLVAPGQARELLTTLVVSGYLRAGSTGSRPGEPPPSGGST
jgi:hypothetical protein